MKISNRKLAVIYSAKPKLEYYIYHCKENWRIWYLYRFVVMSLYLAGLYVLYIYKVDLLFGFL